MDEKLTAMLGLPEEMGFPNRADIRKEAERCISQKAEEMLSASWQDFLYQSGCDTKSLLPMVRRSEIRERAERYYLQNGSLADIHFIPQISLEASFSDAIYLLFLEYREQAAEKIARQWIKRIYRIFHSREFCMVVCGTNSGKSWTRQMTGFIKLNI